MRYAAEAGIVAKVDVWGDGLEPVLLANGLIVRRRWRLIHVGLRTLSEFEMVKSKPKFHEKYHGFEQSQNAREI